MPDLSSVLSFLNRCRQTHIEWRDYIRDCPEDAAEYIAIAGTMEEHERYIRGYDETIELINRLRNTI